MLKDTIQVIISAPSSCLKSHVLCLDVLDERKSLPLGFILVYRPPNSCAEDDDALIRLSVDRLLSLCVSGIHTVLLGDFNLDIDWCSHKANNSVAAKYLELFTCLGLTQHVIEPTRDSSVLDIVLSSAPIIKNLSVQPPFAASDHNSLSFEVCISQQEPVKIPLPNFMRADFISLSRYFDSVDWWSVFQNYSSVEDLYTRFCGIVRAGLCHFVPVEFRASRQVTYPTHIRNHLITI